MHDGVPVKSPRDVASTSQSFLDVSALVSRAIQFAFGFVVAVKVLSQPCQIIV